MGKHLLSVNPFASMIFSAWSMMFDMSICARDKPPVSLHASHLRVHEVEYEGSNLLFLEGYIELERKACE